MLRIVAGFTPKSAKVYAVQVLRFTPKVSSFRKLRHFTSFTVFRQLRLYDVLRLWGDINPDWVLNMPQLGMFLRLVELGSSGSSIRCHGTKWAVSA
jgi:hypothetical protein